RGKKFKSSDVKDPFVLAQEKWPVAAHPDGFLARVVEGHKRYAFISPDDDQGNIDTKDVWLAQVAKKYLTTERQERNFVCVGDRVFCVPAPTDAHIPVEKVDLPQCVMLHMAPRRTRISRLDPHYTGREHVL